MAGGLALTSAQLTAMRQSQQDHHPDLVTITRLQRAADGKGGWTTGTALTVAKDVPCTITPGAEVMLGGQADRGLEIEQWMVTFPWGTDVQDEDVLEWSAESIQLQVSNAKVAKSNGTAVRCTAEVVDGVPW